MKCWSCYKTIEKEQKKVKINGFNLHKKCAKPKVVRFLNAINFKSVF